MADSKLDAALSTIQRLLTADSSAIELYRADFATPTTLEAMRFWAQGELNRVQSGFASTDEVVRLLAGVLTDLIDAINELELDGTGTGTDGQDGEDGKPGATGPQGPQGPAGECECEGIIDDNHTLYGKTWSSMKIQAELDALVTGPFDVMRWQYGGYITDATYERNDVVREAGYTMIATQTTDEYPAPRSVGLAGDIYTGAAPTTDTLAGVLIFGQRYTVGGSGYIISFRYYGFVGQTYSVYLVLDPLTAPVFEELGTFSPTVDGWQTEDIVDVLVLEGAVFDLVTAINQPADAPATLSADWNYRTPNNPSDPDPGEAVQANKTSSMLLFSYLDDGGADVSAGLLAIVPGDTISATGIEWVVTGVSDQGTFVEYTVSPGVQAQSDGVQTFDFQTTVPTAIRYMLDPGYWAIGTPAGSPEGLFIADGAYEDIVPDTNAYGTDLTIQEATIPEDWELVAVSESGGGGSGGSGTGIHNDLSSIQGGVSDERYHLTLSQYNAILDLIGNPDDPNDSQFADVLSLLHHEGTDGAAATDDVIVANAWIMSDVTLTTKDPLMGASSLDLAGVGNCGTGADPKWSVHDGPFCFETILNTTLNSEQIIACVGGTTAGWNVATGFEWMVFRNATGHLEFQGGVGLGGSPVAYTSTAAGAYLAPDTEYAICIDSDGSTIRGFVNGILVWSGDASVLVSSVAVASFQYGKLTGSGTLYFTGTIDESRLTAASRHATNYVVRSTPFPDSA